jgi:hypothetical protein
LIEREHGDVIGKSPIVQSRVIVWSQPIGSVIVLD